MQKLTVLIAGSGKSIPHISNSKFLNKLYITEETGNKKALVIYFNTFKELAEKCKGLKVDLVIIEEEKWILQGLADVLRKNYVNCIGMTSDLSFLILSNEHRRELLNSYGIKTPQKFLLPKDFPVVLCADGIRKEVNSLQEIIKVKEEIFASSQEIAKSVYLEEKIDGSIFTLPSLFDGQTLITSPINGIDVKLIKNYSDNLELMLKNEGFKFVGFINSQVILKNDELYNIGFNADFLPLNIEQDLMFIFISAIYQKLNEIGLYNC